MSIAECPRCGYHLATEFEEGVSALEAEVRRLDGLIPRLQEEKASLLCRINNAQEKTRHLPFEVLSNIFQFACPPIDFTVHEPIRYEVGDPEFPPLTGYSNPAEDFHHTLAAVSHCWRQVALSTPQLWTSISLHVLNTFTDFNTSLLDLYFKNAQNLLISIRLDLSNPAFAWTAGSGWRRSDFLARLEPLKEAIFNLNADKIQSLIFIKPPAEWFIYGCVKLSRCTSVTIFWPSSANRNIDDFVFDFMDLPCLQHIKLVGSDTSFTVSSTISALQLFDTNPADCLRPLEELPCLTELEITGTTGGGFPLRFHNHPNPIERTVVLHHLKKLTWRGVYINYNYDFLHQVRFVNLTTLEWCECKKCRGPLSEEGKRLRLAFFSSLPSTLSSLTFGNLETDSPGLVDLLCCVPQLAELRFIESPREVILGAVKMIGRRPASERKSFSCSNILPNLCAVSILGTGSEIDAFIFIQMLEAMHAAGPRPKQFLLTTDSDVNWQSDALREVRALLSSGMDVKIIFARGESTLSVPSD